MPGGMHYVKEFVGDVQPGSSIFYLNICHSAYGRG